MRPKLKMTFKRLVMLTVAAAAIVPALAAPAQAQLDPGNFEIRQEGRTVGEIFVPERRIHAPNYEEHWVLFDGYRYPAPGVQVVTEIVPTEISDRNAAAFLRRMEHREGATYVHIAAREVELIGPKSRASRGLE